MTKGRIAKALGSILGKSPETPGKGSKKAKKPATFSPDATVSQDDVFLEDEGLFGKVYILSLNEFYEVIGGRTGRLAELLLTICETVFSTRMGKDDGYSLIGEDQYVFRFAGVDDRQALVKAAQVIEEIGTKLLGEHFLKSGQFKAMLTAVGIGDIVDEDGNLDPEKIAMAVDVTTALPPTPAEPDEPKWVTLSYAGLNEDDKWVAVGRKQKDEIQWKTLDYKPKSKDLQWQAMGRDDGGKKDEDIQWTPFKETQETKKKDDFQWTPLKESQETKKKDDIQWEVLDHKKKAHELRWEHMETKASKKQRPATSEDSPGISERRQGEDRRNGHGGMIKGFDRRSYIDRRVA